MTIDTSRRYFFVSAYNKHNKTEDFLANNNWRLGWLDDEDNKTYQNALKHLKNMREGDYIFLRSPMMKKDNLPFPNVNNREASAMRVLAAGIITGIVSDGHTVNVDWFKDYRAVDKIWYFYTERSAIWEVNFVHGRFAVELVDFALNDT